MNFITTCTVLLVVFVIHSAYGFDGVFRNKDCFGNYIYKFKMSLIDCMTECNKARKCMGIVHKRKTCWIKSKCNKRQVSRGSSIYMKPTDDFNFKKGYTCPGNDVAIFGDKMSIAECMIQCNKNRVCIAVTYSGSTCWGKSICLATVKRRSFNTYFKQKGDIIEITNKTCPGNNIYKNGMNISLPLCLQLCGDISQCVGIVYSESTTCWLKSQCTARKLHNSVIYLLSTTGGSIEVIENKNCPHNEINKTGMNISLSLCLQLCGDIPQCVGIVYNKSKTCWLKSQCTTRDAHNSDIHLLPGKDANTCPS